jgi:hypothetical protein
MCVIVAQYYYGTLLTISQYVSIWHLAANKNLMRDGFQPPHKSKLGNKNCFRFCGDSRLKAASSAGPVVFAAHYLRMGCLAQHMRSSDMAN